MTRKTLTKKLSITKAEWLERFEFKPGVEPDIDFDNSTFYDNGAVKDNESQDFVAKSDQVKPPS